MKSNLKIHFTKEEIAYIIKNYPHNGTRIYQDWVKIFGRNIKPQAIKDKAHRLNLKCQSWRVKEIRVCKFCGKEFTAYYNEISHNVQFCSCRCYADYVMRENEKKLCIKASDYKFVYKRDKNFIEDTFMAFSQKNNVIYDDLIAFFWEHQFKYYAKFCITYNKRIPIKRFLQYALLHYWREKKKQIRLINACKDDLITEKYNNLAVSHKGYAY